jgi:hypothetical protein
MTDRAQFEAMLEALINDDQATAKEIFHNIVVGKSREIYEELLESDFSSQDTGNPYAGHTEGAEEEEEESMEEEGDEEESDDSEDNPFGGDDAEDDSEDDSEDDKEDDDSDSEEDPFATDDSEGGEDGAIEDRVMDLEDALEDLKAEFEQLMAGEEAEEHDHPGIHDMGGDDTDMAMGGDDMTGQDGEMDELAGLMEYVNKIGVPYQSGSNMAGSTEGQAVGVQSGSVTGKTNTKSIVASKNDMGGTASNLNQSYVEVHGDAGTKAGGTKGGLASPDHKPLIGKVMNTPGGDAGKTAFKTQVKGGGIDRQKGFNKEGPQVGTGAGDKGTKNTTSIIGKRVK